MAKIKQLKDKSGTEQIFPKTKTQAIYNTDGTLLSETLDDLYGSLATIESSPTTTSHSVGEYILYEGQVYKVTSVIASGDSLVVGTNISAVNLGDQISTLNGQVSTLNSKTTREQITVNYGTVNTARPSCYRCGSIIVLNFLLQLQAGTYNNSDAMWTLPSSVPAPVTDFRFIAQVGTTYYPFAVNSDRKIRPNSSITISSASWMQGCAVIMV